MVVLCVCEDTCSSRDHISKQLKDHPSSPCGTYIDVQVYMRVIGVMLPIAHLSCVVLMVLLRDATQPCARAMQCACAYYLRKLAPYIDINLS